MKTKQCHGCKEVLSVDNFTKNKNMPDGLSYYCRECSKRNYDLYKYKRTDDNGYDNVVVNELKKYNIQINGLDIDKITDLRIHLIDMPGIMRPLMKELPAFLIKYSLTYEEYLFIIDKCADNSFWIKARE